MNISKYSHQPEFPHDRIGDFLFRLWIYVSKSIPIQTNQIFENATTPTLQRFYFGKVHIAISLEYDDLSNKCKNTMCTIARSNQLICLMSFGDRLQFTRLQTKMQINWFWCLFLESKFCAISLEIMALHLESVDDSKRFK